MIDTGKIHQYINNLADVRVLGQIIFVIIVLLVSWSGVKVIHTNYTLQQQISRLQQENEIQKLKNDNQRLKNEYYNSPQYLELAARQNFGLAAPGEKELLVPKAVAMKYVPADLSATAQKVQIRDTRPFYARNLQAWSDFFLHRSSPVE